MDPHNVVAAIEEVRAALRRDVEAAQAESKNVFVPVSVEEWLERLAKAAHDRASDDT